MKVINNVKEKINSQIKVLIEKLPLNRIITPISDFYNELSDQGKNIFILSCFASGIIITVFILSWGFGAVNNLKNEIAQKRDFLTTINRYKEQYEKYKFKLAALEEKLAQLDPDFSIPTFLEGMAAKCKIGKELISSINEKTVPPAEYYQETQATINLIKITLKQLVDYLYLIENSRYNLKVKQIKVKPVYANPQYLDVNFQVSMYRLIK